MTPLRVLVLEEHLEEAELLFNALRGAGFEPDWKLATTEQDYLTHLQDNPDVILARYDLPDFGALLALRRMQECNLDIPFIVVACTASEEAAVECMHQGATDYLLRERLARLGASIRAALERKRLRDEHRRMEASLRESEERFRKVFEENPVGMALVGPDFKLLKVNAALCRMLEYSEAELSGKTFMEFTHPEDVEADLRNAQQLMAGEISSYQMEKRYITAGGAIIWVHLTGVIIRGEAGEPLYGMAIVKNITERKLAEEALRESRERYRIITELITDYASCYRVEPDGSTTREWITADSFTRMSGYTADEIDARPLIDLYHPDDAEAMQSGLKMALRGEAVHGEYRLRTKNGELRWVAVDRRPIWDEQQKRVVRLYGVAKDITARKLAEEELRAHNARSEALAEISQALAEKHRNYRAVLDLIVQRVSQLLGDACVLTLMPGEGQPTELVAFYHPNPDARAFMKNMFASSYGSQKDRSIVNRVVETGLPVLLTNIPMEYIRPFIQPEYQSYLDRFGLYSLLVVPLRVQGRVIGTLGVSRDTPEGTYSLVDQIFMQDLADRAAQAVENARLFEQVEQAREQMRQLARQAVTAQEEERRRISRELHDEAGQSLTALKLRLQMLQMEVPPKFESMRQSIGEVVELTDMTMQHIRLLAQDLRPPVLDTLDFATILRGYCRDFARRTQIQTSYEGDNLPALPDSLKTFLYRFLQETLTNVAKHADASEVQVELQCGTDEVSLMVADDGLGFLPDRAFGLNAASGIGLVGIRERLSLLGGWLEIQSAPGEGSRLTAHIPWERA